MPDEDIYNYQKDKIRLQEDSSENATKSKKSFLGNLSFYLSIISLLLFSWLFQLILWEMIETNSMVRYYLYLIIFILFPLTSLVTGILTSKRLKGIIGLIISAAILLSYLIGVCIFLI
ncbi:MAG: hypothetical protein U9O98_05705 [Asgard group archaeon]|nr:hypothetical protein [Asgard group archaeon]